MHSDKEELSCDPFKDGNKIRPANPKKEVQAILAGIIKGSFINFPFLWAHCFSWPPSLVWEPKLATPQLTERCVNPYFHFYAYHKVLLKMDSAIIQFPIKANMRGRLGFNGPISGLHHPEYIWIASPGLSELCGNQPWRDGLEVKKCGCNELLESIAFQECIRGPKEASKIAKNVTVKQLCVFLVLH